MEELKGFLCAVNFDDRTRGVVRTAALLAQRAGLGLELVHVAEPWDQYGIAHFIGHDIRAATLIRNADVENFQRAESLMIPLVEELVPPDLPVRTRVLKGNAGEVLAREAGLSKSWVVAGFRKNLPQFYPKTMSTTLTLAAECPMPVLFLPEGGYRELDHKAIRILACDDMTPQGLSAVRAACQVAQWYEDADIWHMHVSGLSEQTLDTAVTSAFAESRERSDPGIRGRELFGLMAESMQRKLIKRLGDDQPCPARHHTVLRFGNIETELQNLRGEHALNLAVFGRHHPLHTDPFYVGNLPPSAMFKMDLPILITPD